VTYGVTTGYRKSCRVFIPPHLVSELPHRLYASRCCSTACGRGARGCRPSAAATAAQRGPGAFAAESDARSDAQYKDC
jgi:histidine ammonia-lyase